MFMATLSRLRKKLGLVSYHEVLQLHDAQLLSWARGTNFWQDSSLRKKTNDALIDLFYGLVKETKPDLFIEAGAKTAFASLAIRKHLPDARIVAFEASPENFASYATSQPFKENQIDYRHCAVSDTTGTLTFNVRDDGVKNFGANSLLGRSSETYPVKQVTVPSTRLEDAFPDCPSNALWIDVEGASRHLIAGAKKLLPKTCAVMIEVEDRAAWEGQWLALDVSVALMKQGLVPIARDFELNSQHNLVFLRANLLRSHHRARRSIEHYHSRLSSF